MPDRWSAAPTTRLTSEGYPMRARWGRQRASARVGDDLDAQTIRVEQVGGVVERPVARPQTGLAVAAAAIGESGGVGAVDRDAPDGAERDVPVARGGQAPAGDDPERRRGDAV